MRVNIYAEEMTDRVEIISKTAEGQTFTGLRFYLALPVTQGHLQIKGPFIHHKGDDDSAAVTFWGKSDLRQVLRDALALLDKHYAPVGPVAKTCQFVGGCFSPEACNSGGICVQASARKFESVA